MKLVQTTRQLTRHLSRRHWLQHGARLALAWAAVGIPLAWGVYRTLLSVLKLFG